MIIGRRRVYENVLRIPEGKSGRVRVRHLIRNAGVPIPLSTLRTAFHGQRPMPPVVFDHDTTWHELSETGHGVWMTDLPIEQRQADDALVGYHGDVLVGGLGLGYAATVLAAKKQVRRVVVVERSQHIADLVWPFTKMQGKGECVVADLFDFLRETREQFGFGFFDIWQGDGETTFHDMVVPLRALAHGKIKRVDCWNEDVMRGQLYRGIESRLMWLMDPALREQAKNVGASFEQLTTYVEKKNGGKWINWAVPFWRWVVATGATREQAAEEAITYVRCYGLPQSKDWMARRYGSSSVDTRDGVGV